MSALLDDFFFSFFPPPPPKPINLTLPVQMKSLFVEEKADNVSISVKLQGQEKLFSSLLTYSPIPSISDMYTLHHFFKKTQFTAAMEQTQHLQQELKELCKTMDPSHSSSADCSPVICPCQEDQPNTNLKCPLGNAVASDYQPRSIYDYQPWEYFDSRSIYPDRSAYPYYVLKIKRNVKLKLQQALSWSVHKASEEFGKRLRFRKLLNGWMRNNPYVGSEYIFDLALMDGSKLMSKRMSVVRPLARSYTPVKVQRDLSTTVNFVIPISKVTQRFKEFMAMFEQIVFIPEEKANLVLSVYGQEDIAMVNQVLDYYRSKYPRMHVKVVEGKGEFSRSRALHLGMSKLHPHELAFICDVDMKVAAPFLDRCRANTIRSRRVYYPEFFKLYNFDYVYWNKSKPKTVRLARENGHWAYYSFGMLCLYKSDYDAVGGMDTKISGWGDEDVSFFQKVVRRRLEVMRTPDVGLVHRWHPKHCAKKTLSPGQFQDCLSSREENLADRKELARYVFGQPTWAKTLVSSNVTQSRKEAEDEESEEEDDYNAL